MNQYHLAQVNVGTLRAPLEDTRMEGFRTGLDPINMLADQSPGFVWRLQTETGNAMDIRAFDDPLVAINLSVWESLEALTQFVYRSDHVALLRQRRDWFVPPSGAILALWWVRRGHLPDVAEAIDRLEHLRTHGPSQRAFSFRRPFAAPGLDPAPADVLDAGLCEWAT